MCFGKKPTWKNIFLSLLKVSFIKKPLDYGQVESVGDDTDENVKEMENQSSMSLFNGYPASSVSDANESGESQLTIGKYIFTLWDYFYFFILILHYKNPHWYQSYAHFIFYFLV